jgi:hypothetical protein
MVGSANAIPASGAVQLQINKRTQQQLRLIMAKLEKHTLSAIKMAKTDKVRRKRGGVASGAVRRTLSGGTLHCGAAVS